MSMEAPPSPKSNTTKSDSNIEFEPPQACIRRLLKLTLPTSTYVSKDAGAAFGRACGIFILFLTTCANDLAREGRRTTINVKDVIGALRELEFDEFTPQLDRFLEQYRTVEKTKKEEKEKKMKILSTKSDSPNDGNKDIDEGASAQFDIANEAPVEKSMEESQVVPLEKSFGEDAQEHETKRRKLNTE